jgi:hypothetical protein
MCTRSEREREGGYCVINNSLRSLDRSQILQLRTAEDKIRRRRRGGQRETEEEYKIVMWMDEKHFTSQRLRFLLS